MREIITMGRAVGKSYTLTRNPRFSRAFTAPYGAGVQKDRWVLSSDPVYDLLLYGDLSLRAKAGNRWIKPMLQPNFTLASVGDVMWRYFSQLPSFTDFAPGPSLKELMMTKTVRTTLQRDLRLYPNTEPAPTGHKLTKDVVWVKDSKTAFPCHLPEGTKTIRGYTTKPPIIID